MSNLSAPEFPAGPFKAPAGPVADRQQFIGELSLAPANLRSVVAGAPETLLNTRYRTWTARQIIHHVADSHLHSYVRFKWALTEDEPRIKAYDENAWSALPDAVGGAVEPSLALLDGLHARWVMLLKAMTNADFARTFTHPQTGEARSLDLTLAYYAWHGRHHTAQIQWLCDQAVLGLQPAKS